MTVIVSDAIPVLPIVGGLTPNAPESLFINLAEMEWNTAVMLFEESRELADLAYINTALLFNLRKRGVFDETRNHNNKRKTGKRKNNTGQAAERHTQSAH